MATFLVTTRMVVNATFVVQADTAAEATSWVYQMSPEEALSRACGEDQFPYDFDAEVTSAYKKETK